MIFLNEVFFQKGIKNAGENTNGTAPSLRAKRSNLIKRPPPEDEEEQPVNATVKIIADTAKVASSLLKLNFFKIRFPFFGEKYF